MNASIKGTPVLSFAGLLVRTAAILALLAVMAQPVSARDIRLGGTNKGPEEAEPSKLPPNIVELPVIVVALPKGDGGWRHIRINAWLAPADSHTARDMEDKKSSIVKKARADFPGPRGFDTLKSPHEGPEAAKDILHAAAERSLGHPWDGDVLIQSMVVY